MSEIDASEEPRRGRPRKDNGRAQRVPLGGLNYKLGASERPGYYRHWFLDVGNRIAAAIQAGYTHVLVDPNASSTDIANQVSILGSSKDGQPIRQYLMELPMEFREEDLRARAANNQELTDQIVNPANKDIYVKTAKISR